MRQNGGKQPDVIALSFTSSYFSFGRILKYGSTLSRHILASVGDIVIYAGGQIHKPIGRIPGWGMSLTASEERPRNDAT
jgi:hypothetical protein